MARVPENENPLANILATKYPIEILKLLENERLRRFAIFRKLVNKGLMEDRKLERELAYPLRILKDAGMITGGRTAENYAGPYELTWKGAELVSKIKTLEEFLQSNQNNLTFYKFYSEMKS